MRVRTFIIVGVTVAVIGAVFAYKEYNREPAGAGSLDVEQTVTAEKLYQDFQQDETSAQLKYVGMQEQVIQVSGTVREIDKGEAGITNVILGTGDPLGGVVCEFKEKVPDTWQAGDQVTVKGFCQGMLMDVVLQRCVAVQ